MIDNVNKFLIKGIWIACGLFICRCLFIMPESIYDLYEAIGEVIAVTVFGRGFYNSFFWKFNPLEKVPRLMGTYSGQIEYNFTGKNKVRDVSIIIEQTLLTVKVKIVTNEVTSNTIISSLIEENDEYVLYYTYITNPRSKYSQKNPIQYGTCRLIITNKDEFYGTYWTSRQTIGDLYLKKYVKTKEMDAKNI